MENQVKTNIGVGCFEHPDKTVVASCPNCGKFMCKECATKYDSKLCEDCEKERVAKQEQNYENMKQQHKEQAKNYKKDTVKELIKLCVITVVLGIIGFSIGSSDGMGNGFTMAWLLAGFPWGWRIINQLMDGNMMTWFILLTEKFWIVAYIIKFALAFFIGIFAWPIKLGITIYHVVTAKKYENNVNKAYK